MTKETIELSNSYLEFINSSLADKSAEDILKWSLITFPGLFQTTAFGLTGLVILDMISKISPSSHPIALIFLDTLHHFEETLNLVDQVQDKYKNITIHTYKPLDVENSEQFAQTYGEKLWETNDNLYDYVVKVEPAQRAYEELGVNAVITGRRQSQGGARAKLQPVEYESSTKLIKINPLYNWTFDQVQKYIKTHNVPYNALLDQGYRSVGDFHSTVPTKEGEDERAGRWKGKAKSECGIHEISRFSQFCSAKTAVSTRD